MLKNLVMDQCSGPCGLTLPMKQLYTCDCPCKATLCQKCLIAHAKKIHESYYTIPQLLKKRS